MKFRPWTWFLSYICCFVYMNGCIATPVVKRVPVNIWDLGSSPSGTLLLVFLTFSHIFVTCLQHWAYFVGPSIFCLFLPPLLTIHTLGPFHFLFLIFILFVFLNILFNIKIFIKLCKKLRFIFWYSLFIFTIIFFNHTLFILLIDL